ncbi:MAG TPA: hypothetical protein VLX56_05855 [Nitrososphaerales archaeon]|nr:hypothetical protein [Nitrososphaerales archaeon]
MKPVPVQRYESVEEQTSRCSCGAPGKAFITLAGGSGYLCPKCFVKELRAVAPTTGI